jgi:hypothetical protein
MRYLFEFAKAEIRQRLAELGEHLAAFGAHIQRQTWRGEYWQPRCYRGDERWRSRHLSE